MRTIWDLNQYNRNVKKTLSILVKNEAGILTRVCSVFSSRAFNLETIAVGTTQDLGLSRIIIVLPGDPGLIDNIIKQLTKLHQVLEVKDITDLPCVERELMLIKVNASLDQRLDIVTIANIFRAKVVDISDISLTLEVTGDPGKILTFQKNLEPYGIIEIVRTGKIAMQRESKTNTQVLKRRTTVEDYPL